jgi:hypothetical protein
VIATEQKMAREELDGLELEAELEQLQRKMERLRVLYEQFFQGIERIPPHSLQKDVVRIIHRLTQARIRSTTLKFKLQGLVQRFNAHRAYWTRSVREMEEGRHRKQIARADRRQARASALENDAVIEVSEAEESAAAEFMQALGEPVAKPSPKPADDDGGGIRGVPADELSARANRLKALRDRLAKQGVVAAPPESATGGERATRQVYDRLIEAKQRLGERTEHLSYEAVRDSLEKQAARTREKHGCREVDFTVVVKDGKTLLKPVPR